MRKLVWLLIPFCFVSRSHADPVEDSIKRVNAHISIEDYRSACLEARTVITEFPKSLDAVGAYIRAHAKAGDEKEMLRAWKYYCTLSEDPYKNRELPEAMGWSIIDKGSKSCSPLVRVIALLGAYFAQDARGIRVIRRSLRDFDAMVRDVALQIAATLKDDCLLYEVLNLYQMEQIWSVRLTAIKAIGKMKIKAALPVLMKLIENPGAAYEMRAAALESISEIQDNISRSDLIRLASDSKTGLRELACQLIVSFERENDLDLVLPLINDHNAEVRAAALHCIGMLRPDKIEGHPIPELIYSTLNDTNDTVAIMAAWLMTLYDSPKGHEHFIRWLSHGDKNTRIFASAALKATGKYGQPLLSQAFNETKDPYVKMNLALGLLSQRISTREACRALHNTLLEVKDRLMWKEIFHFRAIAPSIVRHNPAVPHLPEAADSLVRLEVFNALAICNDPHAQESIKKFLEERDPGISATASSLLLMEGDNRAAEMVENLLDHPDTNVRIRSALILALWGEGEKAFPVLRDAYDDADRNMKERILEAFGKIPRENALPFLIDKLREPNSNLKIIAAAALLKSMYN